jgi:hypothetical protein
MKVPTNNDRIQVIAAAALATLAVAVAWSASASAYTVSGSAIRPSSNSASQAQPTGQDRGTLPENTPVVTREATPTDGNADALVIVLSSAALLVALGGVGFTVLASGRVRRAPQPGA